MTYILLFQKIYKFKGLRVFFFFIIFYVMASDTLFSRFNKRNHLFRLLGKVSLKQMPLTHDVLE